MRLNLSIVKTETEWYNYKSLGRFFHAVGADIENEPLSANTALIGTRYDFSHSARDTERTRALEVRTRLTEFN